MSTATATPISEAEARELWADLKNALASTEKAIQRIIETKAWEAMGYDSFAEAWAAEMHGSFLATELRAHVVYAMFAEGDTDEEVREALGPGSGVTIPLIRSIREQQIAGVPEGEVIVREHSRRIKVGENLTLHFEDAEVLAAYHNRAAQHGTSLSNVALDLLAQWYDETPEVTG